MTTTIFGFTVKGTVICSNLLTLFPSASCYSKYPCNEAMLLIENNFQAMVKEAFETSELILFVGAVGIAVRAISPYITTKDKDPAVVVLDENGKYVIPILSGHLGGANQYAGRIAEYINGEAVITTATDINQVFAVDLWAKEQGLYIHNIEDIKYISSSVLRGEKIGILCDYMVESKLPSFITTSKAEVGIVISENLTSSPYRHSLYLTPKVYILGIGCRKDTDVDLMENIVTQTLKQLNIEPNLIHSVATIDIKKKEPAITALCQKHRLGLIAFSSEELKEVKGNFTASAFVQSVVGVDNVCERAACLASGYGELLLKKTSSNGITIAIAKKEWRCSF